MRVICSPKAIVFMTRSEQGMSDMEKAGFEYTALDAQIFCSRGELEQVGKTELKREKRVYLSEEPERMGELMESYVAYADSHHLKMPIAVAPALATDTKHQDLNGLMKTLAKETIRLAGKSGCTKVVVEPLGTGYPRGEEWKENRAFFEELAQLAMESRVRILLKNQSKNMNGHLIRGICSDPEEAMEWVDELNRTVGADVFGFCLDIGTTTICGQDPYEVICALGNRIEAVVIRDGDGVHDISRLPFVVANQTDWMGIIRGLRQTGFDGDLIFDFSETADSFSPIIKPALLLLAKEVADYLKWQIELDLLIRKYPNRALFGAGNMCRNYMKNYGEKYPPLFTCDNNKDRWGEEFCGLKIEAPQKLLEIPEDCAIFICNIYYREIEAQLRELGVTNPIEYFNDEYLASYFEDRLDMAIEKKK